LTAVGLALFGFIVFLAGVGLIYPPAVLLIAGAVITAFGLFAVGFGGASE